MKKLEKLRGGSVFRLTASNRFSWRGLTMLVLPLILGACATEAEFLAQNSPAAVAAALSKGRSELGCPNAMAKLLSQNLTYVHEAGIGLRGDGAQFSEHIIGVNGCDKQVVYEALCSDEDNCKIFTRPGRTLGTQY